MAADPDIVLNTAADPSRVGACLPAAAHLSEVEPGEVEVTWAPAGRAHRYAVTVRPDEHTLEWRPVDGGGWPGGLRVTATGAGASEAELYVAAGDRDADAVRRALDQALRGLATEVDQNFNVS